MNSGDSLYDKDTIENLLKIGFSSDIVTGIAAIVHGDIVKRIAKPRPANRMSLLHFVETSHLDKEKLGPFSIMHQATLIKRELVTKFPYDEKYRIASDYKLWLVLFIQENASYQPIDIPVCRFDDSGCSSNILTREEGTKIIEEMFPARIIEDYKEVCRYKYSKIFLLARKIIKILN